MTKHKHTWHYLSKTGGWSTSCGLWLETWHRFICDCGLTKTVVEKKENKIKYEK